MESQNVQGLLKITHNAIRDHLEEKPIILVIIIVFFVVGCHNKIILPITDI